MKQFNLEEYLKNPSRKVVTRDGRPAEIKCTNYVSLSTAFCVIAEIDVKNVKMSFLFRETDGRFDRTKESGNDLFFASEKYEGWINIYDDIKPYTIVNIFSSKEDAEKEGKKYRDYITTIKIEWEE